MNYFVALTRAKVQFASLQVLTSARPDTWISAATLSIALLVFVVVVKSPIGTGDYGQWLMVSRYYAGESIPDYREIAAVPPVLPLFVASLSQVVHDPIAIMTITKALVVVAFYLATYWAGAGIFNDKSAGLLGATATFLVSDRMLELFAFGGLPQATCLVFLAFAIGFFARAQRYHGLAMRYWIGGSAALLLAALSHAGTGSLAVLSCSAVAIVAALGNSHLSLRRKVIALTPLAVCLMALAPYWLLVILPQNHEYLLNSASLSYRGPWAFWRRLSAYEWNLVVAGFGAVALLIGVWRELAGQRLGHFSILIVWAAAVWGFFALTILSNVGTEYPRFQYPLLQPLALALGGGVAALARASARWLIFDPIRSQVWVPLTILAVTLLFIGPSTVTSFGREAQFYRFSELSHLIQRLEGLDQNLEPDASIVTTVAVGKWFEGVTGRSALFSMPNRYSFRPVERERSLAADVILRSTFSATDGQFFLRYTGLTQGVPTNQWVTINHRGEYVDLLQLSPSAFQVMSGGQIVASLGTLEPQGFESLLDDDVVFIESHFGGKAQDSPLLVSQQAVISKSTTTLAFTYQVATGISVDELRMTLTSLLGRTPAGVAFLADSVDLAFPELAQSQPYLKIRVDGRETSILQDADGGIRIVARNTTTLRFEVSFEPTAPDINGSALLDPAEMVDQYKIEAAVLVADTSLERRIERLAALGFEAQGEVGGFVFALRKPAFEHKGGLLAEPGRR